ncbi:ABC transporter permease [Salinibacterium sp.]|uniref:ABC transporter permease n=1 Tax=Salinibacterium sp. TaxID=1915057 RepID=UPI00286B382A|nr:ABC transporter permease [Salinibacterium sp.]
MSPSFRSVLVVNRPSLIGAAVILTLSAVLLTATGTWLEAGFRGDELPFLVTVASSFAGTLVMITVLIVASVLSGALRPRLREFALLRAVGATAAQIRARVTGEALVLVLIAGPIGAVIGLFVAPLMSPLLVSSGVAPEGFLPSQSPLSVIGTLLVLVPTGVLAARMTARGILRVSPTAAVRESTVEPTALSRRRLVTAAALAITGVLTATTPFFAPGTIGAATGASSALLLVVAAALGGPALVRRAAIRGAAMTGSNAGAGRILAFSNARGFSRRLSAVVIPFALLVALGSVQSGVTIAITTATANQLREGVQTDLIVQSSSGITPAQATAIAALPGVTAIATTRHLPATVRTNPPDEDLPALDGLNWEPTSILLITPAKPLFDPKVQSGSLQDLAATGTIAVSEEALLFTGKGVGDMVDVRLAGQKAAASTIVAVYERGLGFGDYIVGSTDSASGGATSDAVFVDSILNSENRTQQAVIGLGLAVTDRNGYARSATQDTGGEQQLSLVLLLALLGFVAAAAANTLAASIRSRRDELGLLMRLGATRTQVMGMIALETIFIVATALIIGLLAVLPALTGVGQGVLGAPLPVFNLPVLSGLVLSTTLITILTTFPAALHATSTMASQRR